MFLKRFKEKSNQKYINSILNSRKPSVHSGKIGSVGIILNHDEYSNYEKLRLLLKGLGIKDNRVKFIAFLEDEKETPNSWDSFFNPKNFGWKGKIIATDLNEFINEPFDALISYYNEDRLELNMVTAMSKANFKIGISSRDKRLYDLIINIESKYVQVFEKELEKYLKVLNKI